MKYISTNIKVLRIEARLTYEELSEITNISVESLKLFEKGKLVPSTKEVEILCKPLRISYDDIIERDILSERNDAGRRMRKSSERNNYNWYLGNRNIFGIYLGYMLFILIGLIGIAILSKVLGIDFITIVDESGILLPTTWMEAIITSFVIMSYPSGIAFIIWLLIKIRYRFVWWHIFFISFVISLIPICGIIIILPSIGYSFYKSVIKRGKN